MAGKSSTSPQFKRQSIHAGLWSRLNGGMKSGLDDQNNASRNHDGGSDTSQGEIEDAHIFSSSTPEGDGANARRRTRLRAGGGQFYGARR